MLELAVTDVAVGGDGIARTDDGRVVFVTGVVVGDRVRAAVEDDKERFLRASVLEVLEPGPDRRLAPCEEVARGCGGCGWQHITVEGQRTAKRRLAEEALRRQGGLTGSVRLGPELAPQRFRTTLRCAVGTGGRLGYRASRSHRTVEVDGCLVAHQALDRVIRTGRFPAADEVTLRVGADDADVVAVVAPTVGPDIEGGPSVRLVSRDDRDGLATTWVTESIAGVELRVSAGSFFQTRSDGAAALAHVVGEMVTGAPPGRLVDLYGGVGLFAAALGGEREVELVESSPYSSADAAVNLAARDATVVRCRVERWRPSPAAVVIADPPRAGLKRAGVDRIAATRAPVVVTVHCDAASFGRDSGLLAAAGYERDDTVLVDLFPQTPHVELVSRFVASRSTGDP